METYPDPPLPCLCSAPVLPRRPQTGKGRHLTRLLLCLPFVIFQSPHSWPKRGVVGSGKTLNACSILIVHRLYLATRGLGSYWNARPFGFPWKLCIEQTIRLLTEVRWMANMRFGYVKIDWMRGKSAFRRTSFSRLEAMFSRSSLTWIVICLYVHWPDFFSARSALHSVDS